MNYSLYITQHKQHNTSYNYPPQLRVSLLPVCIIITFNVVSLFVLLVGCRRVLVVHMEVGRSNEEINNISATSSFFVWLFFCSVVQFLDEALHGLHVLLVYQLELVCEVVKMLETSVYVRLCSQ